jgi:hypothetical protein
MPVQSRMNKTKGEPEKKEKKPTNPAFQAHLDFTKKARELIAKANGPKGGPVFAKLVKTYTDDAKSQLGDNADKAKIYEKALQLIDKAIKNGDLVKEVEKLQKKKE